MDIELRFFAAVREQLGCSHLSYRTQATTVAALYDELLTQGGAWTRALAGDWPIRMALDQQLVTGEALLHQGAEVAFFPPVTGG